jgi:GMP synthase PP-ATPase subunit
LDNVQETLISNISISNNIVTNEEIDTYFDKIYSIYPRKVSKVQAKETFEHKLRGLEKEEAYKKAIAIYRMLENQNQVWQAENDGQGRKVEHTPYFSSWCNDNVENSPHFKKGRKR